MTIHPVTVLRAYDATEAALSHMKLGNKAASAVWREALAAQKALLDAIAIGLGVAPTSEDPRRGLMAVREDLERAVGGDA